MKESNYFIIRFNDLKEEKQEEIKTALKKRMAEDKERLTELLDMSDYNSMDEVIEGIRGAIEHGCDRSWAEWEVEIKL